MTGERTKVDARRTKPSLESKFFFACDENFGGDIFSYRNKFEPDFVFEPTTIKGEAVKEDKQEVAFEGSGTVEVNGMSVFITSLNQINIHSFYK